MKRIYANGKLVVEIHDNDLQVDTGDDYGDTYNLDSYIYNIIIDNLMYEGITEIIDIKSEGE
jgi:hypothetical protein